MIQSNHVSSAIEIYEKILLIDNKIPEAWYNLGFLFKKTNKFTKALECYSKAVSFKIDQPEEVYLNCAVILTQDLGRPLDALAELAKALRVNSRYIPALLNTGNIHEQLGDREQAHAAYQRALVIDPNNALALSRLPNLQTAMEKDAGLIERLRSALSVRTITDQERADLGFALGKALDNAAKYDQAFDAYLSANAASRSSAMDRFRPYDRKAIEDFVAKIIRAYPTADSRPVTTPEWPRPIFICGMFRSGSTLVEQILASHESVSDGGELDIVPRIAKEYIYPKLDSLRLVIDEAKCNEMRDQYMQAISLKFQDIPYITDKRPDNFLNIGLIKSIFPDSKIIYTTRNAIDNCLSIYFLHLSPSMPFAYDLEDIAHWYLLHQKLMKHWISLYPDDIHEVNYDDLVNDFRPNVEQLLVHCGLPWDERCMDFHKTRSSIMTPSAWQVRQPLYQRSCGRWRHYEHRLKDLLNALGDATHEQRS